MSLYSRILAVILSLSHFLGSRNSLPPLQKGHTPSLGYWGLARPPQKSPRPFFPHDRIIQICLNSGETSQNTPNHTWINWRPIRDFCSRGARVALWYTSEGLLGGLKQEQRSNYPKNWNCHGRPQCTRCKSKKSGFRLKLRIKKLSPRTIWQKSQKEFFYLWLNCNMKTVHLDWLQDCPIGFAKGTLQKLNFKINHKNWVFGLKKSLLSVVLIKKGPQNNLFSYCDGFPKNSKSDFCSNLCICSKLQISWFFHSLKRKGQGTFFSFLRFLGYIWLIDPPLTSFTYLVSQMIILGCGFLGKNDLQCHCIWGF